jgi:hypothetical protein
MDKENKDMNLREEGQGRISPVSVNQDDMNIRQNQRDISEIDRQEGNMNHGELGGNFNLENNKHGK